MKRIVLVLINLLVSILLSGATALGQQEAKVKANLKSLAYGETKTGSGPESPGAELQGTRNQLYHVQQSDTLELAFTFATEFNQTVTVQPDGFITLRMAGTLHAADLTLPALTAQIETAYASILNQGEVSVTLKEFEHPYFLATGEVGRPGKYDLRGDLTMLQAMAIAGGFTDKAKTSQVVLFRRVSEGYTETKLVDMKRILHARNLAEDLHLHPGDMLFVPRTQFSKIERFIPTSSLGLYLSGAKL